MPGCLYGSSKRNRFRDAADDYIAILRVTGEGAAQSGAHGYLCIQWNGADQCYSGQNTQRDQQKQSPGLTNMLRSQGKDRHRQRPTATTSRYAESVSHNSSPCGEIIVWHRWPAGFFGACRDRYALRWRRTGAQHVSALIKSIGRSQRVIWKG